MSSEVVLSNAPVPEAELKLTKKDVRHSYWLWQFYSHANYNYERMQGTSFAMAMAPVLQKLYSSKEDVIKGLQRHLMFFNTNPNVGALIHGAVIAMEEKRANGAEITDESINAVKTGLMGPLAGIGDTIDQGILIPLIVALGISLAKDGNILGSLLVLIGLPIVLMLIAYNSWMAGHRLGTDAVTTLLSGGRMKRLIGAASILGCTVMGGLISAYVSCSTKISFAIGQSKFDLQTQLFDAILPNLLPLAVTLGVYAVLRKGKYNSLVVMLVIAVVGFVLGLLNIL